MPSSGKLASSSAQRTMSACPGRKAKTSPWLLCTAKRMVRATACAQSCTAQSSSACITFTGNMRPLLSMSGALSFLQISVASIVADISTKRRSGRIICCDCRAKAKARSVLRLRS